MDACRAVCEPKILVNKESLRVEYFPSVGSFCRKEIIVTFSSALNKRLEGNFNGGAVLARAGFDVIAFKSTEDDWFQDVSLEDLAIVDAFCGAYVKRYAYGTSAGGFAAIAFSKRLRFDRVLAISPQFSIREDFDLRWKERADNLNWRYEISASTIAEKCEYVVVYDNHDTDRLHIDRLKSQIGTSSYIREIKVPFVGHNVAPFLQQIGLLKKLPLSVFAEKVSFPDQSHLRKEKKRSTIYLNNLSNKLIEYKHMKWAILVMRRANDIDRMFIGNFDYDKHTILLFVESLRFDSEWEISHLRRHVERIEWDAKSEAQFRSDELYFRNNLSLGPSLLLKSWLPFLDKILFKRQCRRAVQQGFDTAFYLSEHPDVANAGVNAVAHYLTHGRFEGRKMRIIR